ncbi:MAG TPA: DUF1801 domain-containing protein [Nocardioidaceae bacterium]
MTEVQEFLEGLDDPSRAVFEHVVGLVRAVAPEVDEGTSYGLPALKYHKKPLMGFRVAKNHLSVFPFSAEAVEAVRERLEGFDLAKGTIRFAVDRPPPDDVVQDLVRTRMREIDGS